MAYVFYEGPKIESSLVRYALAGTAATVSVEVLTHALDTVNMRAKVINGPKMYVLNLLKKEGVLPLLKGIQPIMYGYIISSFVYFYFYANLKSLISSLFMSNQENSPSDGKNLESDQEFTLKQTLIKSFAASAISEILALFFYYPFDLIKTRMQTSYTTYKYFNVIDAFYRLS